MKIKLLRKLKKIANIIEQSDIDTNNPDMKKRYLYLLARLESIHQELKKYSNYENKECNNKCTNICTNCTCEK